MGSTLCSFQLPSILKELKSFLQERISEPDPQKPWKSSLEAITEKLFQMAQKGNLKAMELLFSHAFGKPSENRSLSDDSPEGITVRLISGIDPPADSY
jgi:hypothetical protein